MSSNRFKVYSTYRNEWNLNKHEFDLRVNQNHTLAREELLKEVKGCDAIITSPRFPLDKEVIEAAGDQLKVISLNSSGYNHIDVDECKKRGILIGYCPNTFAGETFRDSVAEFTIGLILSAARSIPNSLNLGREMAWNYIKDNKLLREKPIRGSVIGVFGLGRIGLGVAKRLTPFGISKVIYTNRQESEEGAKQGYEFVPFDQLLKESDFLICSASVNKHNERIFDIDAFKKMKPSSVFVNVGRGTMVNQDDLYQALTKNIISAAAIDVTTPEPLGKDHPLYSLPNCYITPHIAGLDHLTREEMKKVVVTNIINGLNGKPLVHQVL